MKSHLAVLSIGIVLSLSAFATEKDFKKILDSSKVKPGGVKGYKFTVPLKLQLENLEVEPVYIGDEVDEKKSWVRMAQYSFSESSGSIHKEFHGRIMLGAGAGGPDLKKKLNLEVWRESKLSKEKNFAFKSRKVLGDVSVSCWETERVIFGLKAGADPDWKVTCYFEPSKEQILNKKMDRFALIFELSANAYLFTQKEKSDIRSMANALIDSIKFEKSFVGIKETDR